MKINIKFSSFYGDPFDLELYIVCCIHIWYTLFMDLVDYKVNSVDNDQTASLQIRGKH